VARRRPVVLGAPKEPAIAPVEGAITITAANGDEPHLAAEGLLNAATGKRIGPIPFISGSSRFANATGGGTFQAQIDLSHPNPWPCSLPADSITDGRTAEKQNVPSRCFRESFFRNGLTDHCFIFAPLWSCHYAFWLFRPPSLLSNATHQ
jgi:hypothetical protein